MSNRPHRPVLAALRSLLRPVVRLLLRSGVMHREAADVLKALYVEVATSEFGLQGRPTNISRTALLTGLDRKEVRRIRSAPAESEVDAVGRQDRLSRVLSGWHQDAEFSADGVPRRLPMSSASGPSFTRLAELYGGDVPVTALLKELKRTGAVVGDDAALEARKRYYMPLAADADAVLRAGSVLADLGTTVVHNLTPARKAPARFEGRATNRLIPSAAAQEFRDFVENRGQQFLEEVDAWLTAHQSAAGEPEDAVRLGVGLYWIEGSGER